MKNIQRWLLFIVDECRHLEAEWFALVTAKDKNFRQQIEEVINRLSLSGRLVNKKLKTFKMVSSLFGLAQMVEIKVTEKPRDEVSWELCCSLDLLFCLVMCGGIIYRTR